MERANSLQKNRAWREVSLVLCDDSEISLVNQKHLGRREPTDVISFSYTPIPGEGDGHTGEVIVNVQRAVEAAGAGGPGWNNSKELALYIAHGCDHLMDQTDNTGAERNRMRRRELRWVKEADEADLLDGLMR